MPASVIIPAHQAASTVDRTVRAARAIPGASEVIVVDDGSRDGTAQSAKDAGADRVIALPRNRGKGAALRAGVEAAGHERLLFLDADLGDSARHGGELLHASDDRPGMVVAGLPTPPKTGKGGLGLARGLTGATIRLLTGLRMAAPMSGQRALSASLVKHIGLAPRFGVEVGLTAETAHLGLPIVEVTIPFQHQHTGRTFAGFLHRGRQFRDVLLFLLLAGYGLGWPALRRAQTAARICVWLCAFALLILLGAVTSPLASAWVAVTATAALLAWLPVLWASAVSLGLRKANYLGRALPAASGLLFPLIGLPALWFSPLGAEFRLSGAVVLGVLGAVGLLDDLFAASSRTRGLRGHLAALAHGRLTTGVVKALAGIGAGLVAGIILHPGRPTAIALDALLIALSANLVNLLDLRPSRALKGFGLLSALALLISVDSLHLLGPLLAVAMVSAPSDFAGRTMMGDVGANTLGGMVGLALVTVLGPWQRLAAVLALALAHLACERISLSDLIARHRPLSFLDRLGTTHLPSLPSAEVSVT